MLYNHACETISRMIRSSRGYHMPADKGFRIIKEIGVFSVSPESEIHFSIDEFRGHRYGSVRKFLKSESYNGPTHAGVTFNEQILEGVISVLKKLPKEPEALS